MSRYQNYNKNYNKKDKNQYQNNNNSRNGRGIGGRGGGRGIGGREKGRGGGGGGGGGGGHIYSKQEQYERNYNYIITNITERLRKGIYNKNIAILKKDLNRIQKGQEYLQYYGENKNQKENETNNKIDNSDINRQNTSKNDTISSNSNPNITSNKHSNNIFTLRDTHMGTTSNNSKTKAFNDISDTTTLTLGKQNEFKFNVYSNDVVKYVKEYDKFVFCVLFLVSDLYKFFNEQDKNQFKEKLFDTILNDFDKYNLYKKFDYQKKRLNKTKLKERMIINHTLQLPGQTLFMDYFNLNVLVYKPDRGMIFPYIRYNEKYASIILKLDNTRFTPMEYKEEPIINHSQVEKFKEDGILCMSENINPFTNQTLKAFSTYKLGDLQKLAKSFSIDLIKVTDEGKEKKRTKRDLYDEINTMYTI